jgi:hypothetical protein
VGEIEPHPGEQAVPFCVSVQLTPLLLESLLTVAVKFFDCPWSIVWAPLGEMLTLMGTEGGGTAFDSPLHPLLLPAAASTTAIQKSLFILEFITPPWGCGGGLVGAFNTPV